jgi:hypothetical protein
MNDQNIAFLKDNKAQELCDEIVIRAENKKLTKTRLMKKFLRVSKKDREF